MRVIEEHPLPLPYLEAPGVRYRFDNGYTLIVVPKPGTVFNLSTWVKTGSIHEDDANNGVSHFLEHLMFKGTPRFSAGKFDREMEGMGGIINAATWKDFTFYYITAPMGAEATGVESPNFQKAMDMHADMLLFASLPPEEIGPTYNPDDASYQGEKRERAVVIEEISMREDQPWTKVYNQVNHMMYPEGHPYQRDVIGTRQIIGNIPREHIEHYYQQWYAPATMTTLVVGPFAPADVRDIAPRFFQFSQQATASTAHGHTPVTLADVPALASFTPANREAILPGETQTSFFIMGFHGPTPTALEDTIALDIATLVLGGSRSSRLQQALIEKPDHPVFTVVSCDQSTFRLGNVAFIQGNFMEVAPETAMAQVRGELARMLTDVPITLEEFQRAVKKLKVDFAAAVETAAGISESMGESVTLIDDERLFTGYLDALSRVTLAQVHQAARTYLALDKAYTSVLTPSDTETTVTPMATPASH
jgi:zinc protease